MTINVSMEDNQWVSINLIYLFIYFLLIMVMVMVWQADRMSTLFDST